MSVAILLPLYKPNGNHILLFKSVLSSVPPSSSIFVLLDGEETISEAKKDITYFSLLANEKYGVKLVVTELLINVGYPRCFFELCKKALRDHTIEIFHFIDQDDYCLPSRFKNDGIFDLCAGNFISINNNFKPIERSKQWNNKSAPLLETLAPGMTFTVKRSLIKKFVEFLELNPNYLNIPHDFLLQNIAIKNNSFVFKQEVVMLYRQHDNNTIGQHTSLVDFISDFFSLYKILKRKKFFFNALVSLYDGNKNLIYSQRQHRNWLINKCLSMVVRLF